MKKEMMILTKELFPKPSQGIWNVRPGTPEKWDLYSDDGTLFGTIYQGRLVPEGYYHKSVELIITDGQGHLLLTKRPEWKGRGASLWEFPAGSILSGETSYAAAKRKLYHEVGLTAVKYLPLFELASDRPGLRRCVYLALCPNLTECTFVLNAEQACDCEVVTIPLWLRRIMDGSFFRLRVFGYEDQHFTQIIRAIGSLPGEDLPDGLIQKAIAICRRQGLSTGKRRCRNTAKENRNGGGKRKKNRRRQKKPSQE